MYPCGMRVGRESTPRRLSDLSIETVLFSGSTVCMTEYACSVLHYLSIYYLIISCGLGGGGFSFNTL